MTECHVGWDHWPWPLTRLINWFLIYSHILYVYVIGHDRVLHIQRRSVTLTLENKVKQLIFFIMQICQGWNIFFLQLNALIFCIYIYALEHDRIWHVRMKSHWPSPLTRSNDNLSSILFRAELFFWFSVAFPSYKVINITFQGHINYYLTFDMVSRAKWRGGVL